MRTTADGLEVCWETWSANGYRRSTSLTHIEVPTAAGVTFCGKVLPAEGNGVMFCEPEGRVCKKCEAAWSKYEGEE